MSDEQKFSEETRREVLKMAVELVGRFANEKPDSLRRSHAVRSLGYQGDAKNVTVPDLVKHVYNQLLEAMTP